MKLPINLIVILVLALAPVATLYGASGSSGGGGSFPQQSQPKRTPEELAASRYKKGLKHRDKAAKFELQAATEENEKKVAKLQKKVAKEYKKAAANFQKAIKYNPDMYQAHGSLGYAYRKSGSYEDALQAYDTAIRLKPAYGEAIEYRGEAYLGLNRIEDAKQAYMDLFQIDRTLADQLLTAMNGWVAARQADLNGADPQVVEQFAVWVNQRTNLASYIPALDAATTDRWAQAR
jgi:tetratricopeptide (TPR) repeat protein